MTSQSRTRSLQLLVLTTALLLAGCATRQPSSPQFLPLPQPKPTPLPAAIKEISTAPSSDFLRRLDDYLLRLSTWQQKLAMLLPGATEKSPP